MNFGAFKKLLALARIDPANVAITGGTISPSASSPGRSVVLFGDSITAQNSGSGGSISNYYRAAGFFVQANIELGWPFDLVYNAGIGGNNTTQMLARIGTDVLAYKPAWCFVMGGVNDLPSATTSAQTIANLQAIYTQLLAAGIRVVACTITPTVQQSTTAEYGLKRRQINEWIKRYARSNGGIIVADTERAQLDPATNAPLSGYAYDGVHPSHTGARAMGRAIVAAMSGVAISPIASSAGGNGYSINPMAVGSNALGSGGFTGPAGITGVGPNGWDTGVIATGTAVASKTTRSNDWRPDQLARFACSFTADYDGIYVYNGGSDRIGTLGRCDSAWAGNTAATYGKSVRPTTPNGYNYVCYTPGTSAATEPVWSTVDGQFVTDGTVTWRCRKTPVNGDTFVGVCDFNTSSLVGGAQVQLELILGYSDGTFQNRVNCGLQDTGGTFLTPANQIPASGMLVTPPLTLDLSVKSIRYLFAKVGIFGTAGGSVNIDIARLDIVKTN